MPLWRPAAESGRGLPHSKTLRVLVACLAFWCVELGVVSAALSPEEAWQRLPTFHYGADQDVLDAIDRLVSAATPQPPQSDERRVLAHRLGALLAADATDEAKVFICRQLAKLGTTQEAPIVGKLLTDERLSDMARYALAPLADPMVDRLLREALERSTGRIAIGLISSLGYRRDAAAVPVLASRLGGGDPEVAAAAASALGRIGSPEAAQALKAVLSKSSRSLHITAAEAYLACAENLLATGAARQATSLYRELYSPAEPGIVRVAALRGLAVADRVEGVREVVASLREEDPAMRKAALGCIATVPGSAATKAYASELPFLLAPSQVLLLGALAERGDAAALPSIVAMTKSADEQVRVAALRAVGRLGDAAQAAFLIGKAANSPFGEERNAALDGLRWLHGDQIDVRLVRSLNGASPNLRAQLIQVLADRNATSTTPALRITAQDADPRVARAAFKALERLAGPADVAPLLKTLARLQDDGLRELAEQAAIAATRRNPDDSHRADLVLSALQQEARGPAKCSLLRILGAIGTPQAFAPLPAALKDPDAAVRDTALRTLMDWPTPAPEAALVAAFQTTTNETQRTLALRGILHCVSLETNRPPAELLALFSSILPQVRQPEEKRLVLSGLGGVADSQALPLGAPFLKQDAVKAEAALATVHVASLIAATDPDAAGRALQDALAASDHPTVRQLAQVVREKLQRTADYITAWDVAGPYTQPGKSELQLFDLPFAPEISGQKVSWRLIRVNAASNAVPIVDLMGLIGGDDRVAYLRTGVYSEAARQVRLEVGSDDGVKVWLNGKLVHANNVNRGLVPGEDKVIVSLNPGWNVLLLKITQGQGGWAACARLRRPDGSRLENLRIDPNYPP